MPYERQRVWLDIDVIERLGPLAQRSDRSLTALVNDLLRAVISVEITTTTTIDTGRTKIQGIRRIGSFKLKL